MDQTQEIEFAWLLTTGIGITFMLAVAIILFVVFYQKRLSQQQLRMQALKNEQQQQLISVTNQVQEKERKRIAHDLHDDVGVVLSTAKLYLSHLMNQPEAQTVAQKIDQLVATAAQSVRQISHNLSPQNLEKFGLVSAIDEMCKHIREAHQTEVTFEHNDAQRLDLDKELGVYRIVQELLNNTLKHAQATYINLAIKFENEQLILQYHDNGVGVDLEGVANTHRFGLGLQNMIGKAEALKGQIKFQSSKGEGFQATLNIKIKAHLLSDKS
ncbi:sensor histidine kinase [Microscilla marina]|uniref:histidine kinase n=1 Tax=Microscilla marina ATCC 23134 TaxID=313606 RepID=A1ZJR9_MICM2|nr:sensor histidine kinase [Microscilla marina]EAY29372.1 sensor protein ComP, putative [Microscilla marina ATCC 23134]